MALTGAWPDRVTMPGMTVKKLVALVAALALTLPVAGCGMRERRGSTGPQQTQTQPTPGPTATVDPAAAQSALDDLDSLLGDANSALSAAASAPADAD
jgi:hypothetical protein